MSRGTEPLEQDFRGSAEAAPHHALVMAHEAYSSMQSGSPRHQAASKEPSLREFGHLTLVPPERGGARTASLSSLSPWSESQAGSENRTSRQEIASPGPGATDLKGKKSEPAGSEYSSTDFQPFRMAKPGEMEAQAAPGKSSPSTEKDRQSGTQEPDEQPYEMDQLPDGSKRYTYPSGIERTEYINGDSDTSYPNGKDVYRWANGETETTLPNHVIMHTYPQGDYEIIYPGGLYQHFNGNGVLDDEENPPAG